MCAFRIDELVSMLRQIGHFLGWLQAGLVSAVDEDPSLLPNSIVLVNGKL